MAGRPEPEIEITPELARALLREQAPELAELPLAMLGMGWDNTNWRLGDDLIVRLPHRKVAEPLIRHEQRWLPELAPRLDLAIPVPVVHGQPSEGHGYPWVWSVVPWNPGDEAANAPLVDPATTAEKLGTFFRQLHTAAPADAPPNPFRGGPIADRRDAVMERIEVVADRIDGTAALVAFEEAASTPTTNDQVWLHGDVHTRNMVVDDGDLTAVIDWGDICRGDRATDLAGAFMLVPDHIDVVRATAGADDDAWRRARGWAIHFALIYLAAGEAAPVMNGIGDRLLRTLEIGVR
jgi:aminoglycoside phosphotransferase (APT) family kinase protein